MRIYYSHPHKKGFSWFYPSKQQTKIIYREGLEVLMDELKDQIYSIEVRYYPALEKHELDIWK